MASSYGGYLASLALDPGGNPRIVHAALHVHGNGCKTEVSATEVGPHQVGPAEIRIGEIGSAKVRPAEASAVEVGPHEVGSAEVDDSLRGIEVCRAGAVPVTSPDLLPLLPLALPL